MQLHLTLSIDDRLVSFFKKRVTRRALVGGLVGLGGASALIAYAASVPNTFTAGTVISSSQVNDNFKALTTSVTALEGSGWAATANTRSFSGGNVGIGTATPESPLDVTLVGANGTSSDFVTLHNQGPGATQESRVVWKSGGDSVYSAAIASQPGAGFALGDLRFQTAASGTLSTKMLIDNTGNVGIGTTAPNALLDVRGNLAIGATPGAAMGNQQRITSDGAALSMRVFSPASVFVEPGDGAAKTQFSSMPSCEANTQVCVASNGNLGVGTLTPAAPLDVAGAARVTLASPGDFRVSGPGGVALYVGNNGAVGLGTASPTSRLDLGGGCMTGSTCSDRSLKTSIQQLPRDGSALSRVLGMQGVSFEWKNQPGRRSIGLIAQEVERVAPEVVSTSPSDGQKGLSCTGIDALLVEAIRAQQQQIQELKAELHQRRKP